MLTTNETAEIVRQCHPLTPDMLANSDGITLVQAMVALGDCEHAGLIRYVDGRGYVLAEHFDLFNLPVVV